MHPNTKSSKMIKIDKTLNIEEKTMLASLKGYKINSIEGAFRFDDVDVWNTLRINAEKISLDINLFQENLPVDEKDAEETDDTGVFSIKRSSSFPLIIDSVPLDIKSIQIQRCVDCIRVFESQIKYYDNEKQYYQNSITKAIAILLGEKWMVLDRKIWFDEAITITFCQDVLTGIRDDSQDWDNADDDDKTTDNLRMEYSLESYDL